MQKINTLIGLSVISFSLLGMKTNNHKTTPKQLDYIVTIAPIGGYLMTDLGRKELCANRGLIIHNDAKKLIHYKLVNIKDSNGNLIQTDQYEFKDNYLPPIVPLNLLTENKKYIAKPYSRNEERKLIIKLISDDNTYEEHKFIPYNEFLIGKKS